MDSSHQACAAGCLPLPFHRLTHLVQQRQPVLQGREVARLLWLDGDSARRETARVQG